MQWQALWPNLKSRWTSIPPNKRIRFGTLGGAVIILAVIGGRWVFSPHWTPLYNHLSPATAGAMTTDLQQMHIPYQLGQGGTTIRVPAHYVDQARVSLAEKNLPGSSTTATFPQPGQITLGETNQQIQMMAQANLEQSLAQTIDSIQGISKAHIVITAPPPSLFGMGSSSATASVFINVAPGNSLSSQQVNGIQNLVAAAVNGLTANHVTVVNQFGTLLSGHNLNTLASTTQSVNQSQYNATTLWESHLSHQVETMLDQVYGPGAAIARVHALLNFQTQTSHIQTAAKGIIAQQQVTTKKSKSAGVAAKAAGAAGNVPNYPVLGANGPSSSASNQTITRYTVPVTTKVVSTPQGGIQRLSVAVVLNHNLTAAQQRNIQSLVAQATGAPLKNITVSGIPFNQQAAATFQKKAAAAQAARQQLLYIILGVLALLALFIWWRLRRRKAAQLTPANPPSLDIEMGTTGQEALPQNEATRQELVNWSEKDPQAVARILSALMEENA